MAIVREYIGEVMKCPILEWINVAEQFSKRWIFHHTIGAIDGKILSSFDLFLKSFRRLL